jgi:1-acyl-sn-glycerol-3-phosphate acyltransferase
VARYSAEAPEWQKSSGKQTFDLRQQIQAMNIPELGPLTPQRGNVLTRAIGRLLLAGYRWQVEGNVHNAPKVMGVLAPHTSSWDFYTTIATMLAVGFRSSWLIADAYTWWPLGVFMRWLGGIPVKRNASNNLVSQIVKSFDENDRLLLALFPEGTRKNVIEWKTGFWHIAVQAEVPIQLISLDYDRRVTEFGPVIEPSHSLEADMERIQKYFHGVEAKYPDKFGG